MTGSILVQAQLYAEGKVSGKYESEVDLRLGINAMEYGIVS